MEQRFGRQAHHSQKIRRRVAGIDGMRAVAISLVIYTHYFSWQTSIKGGDFGGVGVSIFFVISGYLITSVLLYHDVKTATMVHKFVEFYTRRALRIIPTLFIVVTIAYLLGAKGFREYNPIWFYGFIANALVMKLNAWPGSAGALWSIAVEEQFYLVWPAIILIIPRCYLFRTILIFMAATPISAAFWAAYSLPEIVLYVSPIGHLFALGIGALLAYAQWEHPDSCRRLAAPAIAWVILTAIFITTFGTLWLHQTVDRAFIHVLCFASINILSALVINEFWKRPHGRLASAMEWWPLRQTGVISYTLYLCHVPTLYVLQSWVWEHKLGWSSLTITLVALGISFVYSMSSWLLIEKPLLAKKSQAVEVVAKNLALFARD